MALALTPAALRLYQRFAQFCVQIRQGEHFMADAADDDSENGEPSRPWWKHLWVWVSSLVAAIVAGLAISLITDTFKGDSNSPPDPTPSSPKSLTTVHAVAPLGYDGKLLEPFREARRFSEGRCIESFASSDPNSWRCFAGTTRWDPCWVEKGVAACLNSPWDHEATVITKPRLERDAPTETSFGETPWALEILSPTKDSVRLQCSVVLGGTGSNKGERLNWSCFPPGPLNQVTHEGDAYGAPDASASSRWTVTYKAVGTDQSYEATITDVYR